MFNRYVVEKIAEVEADLRAQRALISRPVRGARRETRPREEEETTMSHPSGFTERAARPAVPQWRLVGLCAALLAMAFATACGNADSPSSATPVTTAELRVNGAALDAHVHLMSSDLAARTGAAGTSTADDLIEKMDAAHVERAVVLSTAYMSALPDDASMSAENDFAAAQVARYPDRLIGFCGINPLRASAVPEIDRCTSKPGMRGLKLHLVGSELDVANDQHLAALAQVFDRAEQRDLPVTIHVANPIGLPLDSAALTRFGTIVATHPNVRVAFAHGFSLLDNQQLEWLTYGIQQGVFKRANVFIDVSAYLSAHRDAPLSEREVIVWRLRQFGLDHVLFGSDYLAVDPSADTAAEALEAVSAYPFTRAELDSILGNDGSAWLAGD